MKKKIRLSLALAFAAAFTLTAQVQDAAEQVTGMGATYRAAVNEALVTALEKHQGLTMSTSQRSDITSAESSVDDSNHTLVNDAIQKQMQKWAKGKITGYDVLSESFDPVTKKYTVALSVRFPGRYIVGRDPNALRRMAVVPFRPATGDSYSWYGQPESAAAWAAALAARLNERLTQTRKFTMVDRKFDAEVNDELARLCAANAAPGDTVRLNQKLGTDYLVVGDVKLHHVTAPGVNPYTKQPLPQASQLFAEVTYRVLLAPTGQLKWMDTVTVDALDCPAGSIAEFASKSANLAAQRICAGLMDDILPFEVAALAAGQIVIGEGGKQLKVGERFTICALGDEVKDTRTGEVIDVMEIPVGTAEVTSVGNKLSYARIVEGDAAQVKVGARLRRVPVPREPAPAPPITTTIRATGSGSVVTPF